MAGEKGVLFKDPCQWDIILKPILERNKDTIADGLCQALRRV